MKKRLFLMTVMVVACFVSAIAQPANGFYRIKNNAGAGSKIYAQMESNRYSSVMGTATSALTDASTVFYLELGTVNSDGSYPINQLRSQMVNCPSQTAYIPLLVREIDEDSFNQLKAAFYQGATTDANKAKIEAFTLSDFQTWVDGITITMNLKSDNGSYVVFDTCDDFPCGADMNDEMNAVWSNATLQAQLADMVDKVLPTTDDKKELNATFKSMISAFRFGGTIYLGEDSDGEFSFTNDGTATNAHWTIEDIDDTNYFAVAPNSSITQDGKYYSTIYLDFAVQLPDGVTAWYVSSVEDGTAVCEQLEGSIVPRFLPVILESESSSAAENKLTPVAMTAALWTLGNTTRGSSLLDNNNVRSKTSLGDNSSNVNFYPQTYSGMKNDQTHFRVLSVSGGELGFYKYSGTTMEVNKAYLYIASGSSNAKVITLDFGGAFGSTTAIKNVNADAAGTAVYDLQGRRVTNFNSDLPRGIYVMKGKKVIVK